MKSLLLSLPLLLASLSLQALELPDTAAVAGGIVQLPLTNDGPEPPDVRYRKHRVMVVSAQDTHWAEQANWVAIVGIPLSVKAGTEQVSVDGSPLQFSVGNKKYREQRLTIKNKRKVNPTKLDMTRINREKQEILTALANWSETDTPVTRLLKPAQGPYSSPFGLRRFFNDQPRKPHSGLDIAAPKGSPIIAPAAATVVATGDYFFNGRTVILDHGLGLTTMYCHMNRIDVNVGDRVDSGQQLGTIGATGRVTGPHLHWGVSLNNARINPSLMMIDP